LVLATGLKYALFGTNLLCRPDLPHTIWKAIDEYNPDLWIWLGDVVYNGI
jgi:hypothetical protein